MNNSLCNKSTTHRFIVKINGKELFLNFIDKNVVELLEESIKYPFVWLCITGVTTGLFHYKFSYDGKYYKQTDCVALPYYTLFCRYYCWVFHCLDRFKLRRFRNNKSKKGILTISLYCLLFDTLFSKFFLLFLSCYPFFYLNIYSSSLRIPFLLLLLT